MPTIKMNKQRFIRLLGRRMDDDELAYELAMIGTDVDEITSDEIIVEVFPNRPDMLSEEGFARAMRYFLELEDELKRYEVKRSDYVANLDKKALKPRPYVACAVVKNVRFDDQAYESLISLQEKLHITHGRKRRVGSIGVHNLDVITFPLRYVAVDKNFSFIPLGWDSEATIEEILNEHPKGKEYGHLLKDIYPVWMDANNNVLALPPIINSSYTAIDSSTKNFFIDVTGTNERVVNELLNIVVAHLEELGGEIYEVNVSGKSFPNMRYRKKLVEYDYVNNLLGLNLNDNYIEDLLLRMGIGFEHHKDDSFYALIPPYRTDILHPMDVVEDIAIAYGYDNFKYELPSISTIGSQHKTSIFENILRDIFSGLEAQEVITYHLSNVRVLSEKMMKSLDDIIFVKHPMNEEYDALRNSILPLLLDFLSYNTRYEYPQFIFEIGNVFRKSDDKIVETTVLAWVYANTKASYEDAKSIVDAVMRELGITYRVEEYTQNFLIKGRAANIVVDDVLGYFGEIHPRVVKNFELSMPVVGGEIYVERLQEKVSK